MDLTKIAYTPPKDERKGTVRLEWTVTRLSDDGEHVTDERTLRSTDAPHPDFLEALKALARPVAEACFVSPEERESALDEDRITVRGVTLKSTAGADGDTVDGVTITALRELDWSAAPLVLNTPFAPVGSVPYAPLERLLDELKRQARAYAGGRRAQGSLFDGEAGGDGARSFRDEVGEVLEDAGFEISAHSEITMPEAVVSAETEGEG